MLFSIKWLEEFLKTKIDVDKLERLCLNLGLEIEERKSCAPRGIKIGRIASLRPHPRQKNLTILDVKANKNMQIVTAARNVRKGDLVLTVPAGGLLNETPVTERDFSGAKSQGVLVSEQELGMAESSTGVIVLDRGTPGADFTRDFDDQVVEIRPTPNRPDWLSMEGIAREISGSLGIDYAKISSQERLYAPKQINRNGNFRIKIEDMNGCPRYTGRIFEEVRIGESPFSIKWRLHCMGMHSINNVVDITNLIMLLTGQPLHPFDLDILKGGIFIRRAKADEKFVTLDGTMLRLSREDLVIADRDGPVALAGIIGAKRAQISTVTKKVLLESAYFDAKRVGHTARRLGIMTDASTRFERGADMAIVDAASAMAGALFEEHADCRKTEFIGQGKKAKPKSVRFSLDRLNRMIALDLSAKQVKEILKKISIVVTGAKYLTAKIPHFRRDLHIEEDICEEVARVFGYMNIPEIKPLRWVGHAQIDKPLIHEETIRNYLVGQGFDETCNLSLMSSKLLAQFGYKQFVRIKNPLNERFDALRPTLLFGLLDSLNYNLAKGSRSLMMFEIGNILLPNQPFQEKRLGVIMGGHRFQDSWQQHDDTLGYFDAKGMAESLFRMLHLPEPGFKPANIQGFKQAVAIGASGKELGYLGVLGGDLCKEPYCFFELTLDPLLDMIGDTFYMPPPRFPTNTRDLSFITDETVQVPEMAAAISNVSGPILEKVVLFDYYKGKNLPP
ncbi:MAG: phenylalanine--tRNA ligase subunit beta, partial [candidate division WOR-3 bacterium]